MLNRKLIVAFVASVGLFFGIYSFAQTDDTEAPVITLKGDAKQTIEVGSKYVEKGATAIDDDDTDLTDEIIIDGKVDENKVGTYKITYNVSDSAGNDAEEVVRTVYVVDTTSPVITLNGQANMIVRVHSNYVDAGVTVIDNYDKDIVDKVSSVSNVNTNIVGVYTVTYDVTDSEGNVAQTVVRTVNVVDTTAPIITLLGAEDLTIEVGSTYTDAGATALDNYDNDITNLIVVTGAVDPNKVGAYTITYDVTDSNGNVAQSVVRTVNVVDTTAPIITLLGAEDLTIEVGSTYTDAGATATDNYDQNIDVITTGTVVANVLGDYIITYNAVDSNGNKAIPVVREVHVVDTKKPTAEITYSTTAPTKGKVRTTIKFSEPLQESPVHAPGEYVAGGKFVKVTDTEYYIDYYINMDFEFNFKDLAGNVGTDRITITNIDKKAPTAEITYSTTAPTNGDVVATLTASEALKDIYGWNKVSATEFTKAYPSNKEEIITFEDLAGNQGIETLSILNIDKEKPNVTLLGNDPETVIRRYAVLEWKYKIDFTDEGFIVNNESEYTSTKTITYKVPYQTDVTIVDAVKANVGTYVITYTITDAAGNSSSISRTVYVVRSLDTIDDISIKIGKTKLDVCTQGDCLVTLEKFNVEAYDIFDDGLGRTRIYDVVYSGNIDLTKVGDYSATFTATDWMNKTKSVNKIIKVRDTEAPVITLTDATTTESILGVNVEIPVISVTDNYDKDLNIEIDYTYKYDRKGIPFFTATTDIYLDKIIYKATDASGNSKIYRHNVVPNLFVKSVSGWKY